MKISISTQAGTPYRYEVQGAQGNATLTCMDEQGGLSPMENLLASLAGCMLVDLQLVLRRYPDLQIKAQVEGSRVEDAPQIFEGIQMQFAIQGSVPDSAVQRAIDLAIEKYCSVYHMLRPDVPIDVQYTIDGDN